MKSDQPMMQPPMTPGSRSVNLQELFNGAAATTSGQPDAHGEPKPLEEMMLTPAMFKNLKPGRAGEEELSAPCAPIKAEPPMRQASPPLLSQQLLHSSKLFKPDACKQAALSMEQLKQTLVYLLQTDADFLHHIHSTYVNSLHR